MEETKSTKFNVLSIKGICFIFHMADMDHVAIVDVVHLEDRMVDIVLLSMVHKDMVVVDI